MFFFPSQERGVQNVTTVRGKMDGTPVAGGVAFALVGQQENVAFMLLALPTCHAFMPTANQERVQRRQVQS